MRRERKEREKEFTSQEARADNKRADAVTFYLSPQDRKGTCLVYSSFHHCAA